MFKKLLNSLLGNNNDEQQPASRPQPPAMQQDHEDEFSDDDDEEDDEDEMQDGSEDPVTHHGLHYTAAQFDAEVERRVNGWKEPGEKESEIRNARINFAQDVFREWNPNADESQLMRFHHRYSNDAFGYSTFGTTQHDDNNPLLQSIHGISLQDYGAASSKMASGISAEAICKALGVEAPVWQEASTLWVKRMQEDGSFTVTNLFSQYFGEAAQHPKLGNLSAAPLGAEAQAVLDRLNTDRYFYEELCGARQAAYEYGLDGAQWIQDNFGVTLGDFQGVAMKWMTAQNQEMDSRKILHFHEYQQEKQKEYAAKFAAEQGGNVADDVAF